MLEFVVRVVGVMVAFLVAPLLVGQAEHKVMAHMQSRLGPMYAGAFHGWAQLVADGVKFVQKESVVPAAADRRVFEWAPFVAILPYMAALAAIPLAPGIVGADLDSGLFFVLAVMSIGVLGSLMAGWGSGNKYSLLGGLRVAAQLMSYELPFVLSAASVAVAAGSLSLTGIGARLEPVVAALAAPRPDRLLHRGPRRAAAAAVRHAGRGLRGHLRPLHRVHRAPVRPLPARRVRRHRHPRRPDHSPVPRRLERPRPGVASAGSGPSSRSPSSPSP